VEVTMGTLSKALGSYGAFVCGSRALIEFLINRCRPFIYSTALPPPAVAAALAALEILEEEPERRAALWDNTGYLREGIERLGFRLGQSRTPILPLHVGEAGAALRMAELLLERGVFALAIRPPTVPEGTSRLRLTTMATHSRGDLDRALEALEGAGKEVGII
ncbi:MAG: aminotransferase class I/II-fold pyridoxal phosphate-dependent enzyme, partial [Nitrospinota bacterium]